MVQQVSFVVSSKVRGAPSTYMRVDQMIEILKTDYRSKGYEFNITSNPKGLKDNIIIFGKYGIFHQPEWLKQELHNDNKIIFDHVDSHINKRKNYVDLYCTSSYSQHLSLQKKGFPVHYVCHHADPRVVAVSTNGDVEPRVGYYGIPTNTHIPREAPVEVTSITMDTKNETHWVEKLSKPHIHYIVRKRKWHDGFKPFTKGILAAHCNSLVVAQRDVGDNNYFLQDYPYMVSKECSDVEITRMVIKSMVSVKNKDTDYKLARAIMRNIKIQSSFATIIDQYYQMLNVI